MGQVILSSQTTPVPNSKEQGNHLLSHQEKYQHLSYKSGTMSQVSPPLRAATYQGNFRGG